jgi:hypothetical protein
MPSLGMAGPDRGMAPDVPASGGRETAEDRAHGAHVLLLSNDVLAWAGHVREQAEDARADAAATVARARDVRAAARALRSEIVRAGK